MLTLLFLFFPWSQRGPRYFDPPDSSWGTCFKCGEEGHSTANCTTVKRRKPCFVCGSLEHASRQCSKVHGKGIEASLNFYDYIRGF